MNQTIIEHYDSDLARLVVELLHRKHINITTVPIKLSDYDKDITPDAIFSDEQDQYSFPDIKTRFYFSIETLAKCNAITIIKPTKNGITEVSINFKVLEEVAKDLYKKRTTNPLFSTSLNPELYENKAAIKELNELWKKQEGIVIRGIQRILFLNKRKGDSLLHNNKLILSESSFEYIHADYDFTDNILQKLSYNPENDILKDFPFLETLEKLEKEKILQIKNIEFNFGNGRLTSKIDLILNSAFFENFNNFTYKNFLLDLHSLRCCRCLCLNTSNLNCEIIIGDNTHLIDFSESGYFSLLHILIFFRNKPIPLEELFPYFNFNSSGKSSKTHLNKILADLLKRKEKGYKKNESLKKLLIDSGHTISQENPYTIQCKNT